MTAAPYQALAAAVGESQSGRLAAQRFLAELRTGPADPDRLFYLHYQVQTTPATLQGFMRELQRALERGGSND